MAAQRPSGQAWFRMPTMRPPAPAPASPPAVVRPAMPVRPPTQPQVAAAPPPAASSQPPSPPPKSPVAPPAASPPVITKAAITPQPPSPPAPPQIKAQAPSPLQLPPAQIKPSEEQKSVLVQESVEKQPLKTSNAAAHNYSPKGKRDTPTKDKKKQLSDSEDFGMRIITISGDNRGALMEISSSHKKSSNGYTLIDKTKNGKAKANESGEEEQCDDQSQPIPTTFLNSNVQGVNNSIVYNSSCHNNDPGIHLSLLRKPNHHHHG